MTDDELHRALLMHDGEYRVVLGFLRSAGFAIPAQGAMACRWVLDEAKLGNARARFAAAKLLSVGLWIKQDKNQAREWCEKAADQQLPEAITMLGGFHESGWGGLEASRTMAIELWQRAIDLGETDAMCAMATLHFHDQSSSEDPMQRFLSCGEPRSWETKSRNTFSDPRSLRRVTRRSRRKDCAGFKLLPAITAPQRTARSATSIGLVNMALTLMCPQRVYTSKKRIGSKKCRGIESSVHLCGSILRFPVGVNDNPHARHVVRRAPRRSPWISSGLSAGWFRASRLAAACLLARRRNGIDIWMVSAGWDCGSDHEREI
jgi:hypothetical protein